MEKVSAMKRCKLLSSCRESFSFLQERRRRKEEEGVGERRRGKRDRGLGSGRRREREEARDEWERLGGRGQASSLPGFALLGSSEELRVTDHQTDGADTLLPPGALICLCGWETTLSPPPPIPPADATHFPPMSSKTQPQAKLSRPQAASLWGSRHFPFLCFSWRKGGQEPQAPLWLSQVGSHLPY